MNLKEYVVTIGTEAASNLGKKDLMLLRRHQLSDRFCRNSRVVVMSEPLWRFEFLSVFLPLRRGEDALQMLSSECVYVQV